jgi:hypothetical protein
MYQRASAQSQTTSIVIYLPWSVVLFPVYVLWLQKVQQLPHHPFPPYPLYAYSQSQTHTQSGLLINPSVKHIHRANLRKFTQIYANLRKFTQIHANLRKFTQIHANLLTTEMSIASDP